jgi:hypothetical protein
LHRAVDSCWKVDIPARCPTTGQVKSQEAVYPKPIKHPLLLSGQSRFQQAFYSGGTWAWKRITVMEAVSLLSALARSQGSTD